MQQTSGSSFCCCGDDDEGFVFISFSSLPPSFLGGRGGGDAVVVVVVCFLLMVYDRYYQPLWLIVRWFDCVLMVGDEVIGPIWLLSFEKGARRSSRSSIFGSWKEKKSTRRSFLFFAGVNLLLFFIIVHAFDLFCSGLSCFGLCFIMFSYR